MTPGTRIIAHLPGKEPMTGEIVRVAWIHNGHTHYRVRFDMPFTEDMFGAVGQEVFTIQEPTVQDTYLQPYAVEGGR